MLVPPVPGTAARPNDRPPRRLGFSSGRTPRHGLSRRPPLSSGRMTAPGPGMPLDQQRNSKSAVTGSSRGRRRSTRVYRFRLWRSVARLGRRAAQCQFEGREAARVAVPCSQRGAPAAIRSTNSSAARPKTSMDWYATRYRESDDSSMYSTVGSRPSSRVGTRSRTKRPSCGESGVFRKAIRSTGIRRCTSPRSQPDRLNAAVWFDDEGRHAWPVNGSAFNGQPVAGPRWDHQDRSARPVPCRARLPAAVWPACNAKICHSSSDGV